MTYGRMVSVYLRNAALEQLDARSRWAHTSRSNRVERLMVEGGAA
jgi:hypothetical protein